MLDACEGWLLLAFQGEERVGRNEEEEGEKKEKIQ